jgi:hypothetical protein
VRFDEWAYVVDQPAVSLRVVEPVQFPHSLPLHRIPRRKPFRFRRIGGQPKFLLGQVALGECLGIVMGAVFCLGAQEVQADFWNPSLATARPFAIGVDGPVVPAHSLQDFA